MLITHRIALDPTNKQATLLRQHAGYARFAWNWGVAECRRALDAGEPSATRHQRFRPLFNAVKNSIAPWSSVLSQNAAKYALIGLGDTWNLYWSEREKARKAGKKSKLRPPCFKKRKAGRASFRADNGPGTVLTEGKTIRLPKIGTVRTREACRFPGPIRECTVKHDGVWWYAIVVCEFPDAEPRVEGDVVSVDVGLRRLATVYDGDTFEVIDNPRPLRAALSKLRRVNRRIARSRKIHGKTRHSNRRERTYKERRRLYAKVSHLRMDAAHKATTAIAKRSRLVCVESLRVEGWMRNRRLARSTADASPGRFLSLLKWKCRREGAELVEADRFYPSSKTCSTLGCGYLNSVLKSEEYWCCPTCGVRHHRDENASVNLRRQALAADVEGMSDGRVAAVPSEALTRQMIPD